MRRIAIFSTAGGGGKTTTTMNLAAALAERGQRVLVADLDPGACLLRAFGQGQHTSLFDAITENGDFTRHVRPSSFCGVFLLTACPRMDTEEHMRIAGPDFERSLAFAFEHLFRQSWSFVLLDCGSAVTRLATTALSIADEHIAPIEPSPLSIGSLRETLELAKAVRSRRNPGLAETRILVSRITSAKAAQRAAAGLRDRFEGQILKSGIPHSQALVEASAHFEPIGRFEQGEPATTAYRGLASELLEARGAAAHG
ncbi:MAG: ParA family protein [bacterium]|nr:ParA family protein [bacterium]